MSSESFISLCITSIVRRSEVGFVTFHTPKFTLPNHNSQICFEGSYSAEAGDGMSGKVPLDGVQLPKFDSELPSDNL